MSDTLPDPVLGHAHIYYQDEFEASGVRAACDVLRDRVALMVGPVPQGVVVRVEPIHLQVEPGETVGHAASPSGRVVAFRFTATAEVHLEDQGARQ